MSVPDGPIDDETLYARGTDTLLACWEAIARGCRGAAVHRLPGVAAAVFPHEPERAVYNNALLDRGLGAAERAAALDAMEHAYASAGVERYAAFAHEADEPLGADLEARGYTVAETTRSMGMCLSQLRAPRPHLDLADPDWAEYRRYLAAWELPEGFYAGVDPRPFHLLLARVDGETVGSALGFDLAGDCGVYNVSTLEHARRRGLGSALTARLLHDAAARGCRTASLQATPIAERIYATLGFRDLGRLIEYVPGRGAADGTRPRA
jgi:ribosomal protein S18 acetylase RimI-like enzyme